MDKEQSEIRKQAVHDFIDFVKRGGYLGQHDFDTLEGEFYLYEVRNGFEPAPQPEHKSMEDLKHEFWKLFVCVGHSPSTPDSPEEWDEQWNDLPSDVWPWIASHLNSRNLLERFQKWWNSQMEIKITDYWLDEFIESEGK